MSLIDFSHIERSWEPGSFVRFMESNPITKLFWNIVKCCFGYNDHYRCNNWDNAIYTIRFHRSSINVTHPDYGRYYSAVQRVLYYNPHLRQEFTMAPPITNTHVTYMNPVPLSIQGRPVPGPVQQGVPPPTSTHLGPAGVPFSLRSNPVPPPTSTHTNAALRPGVPLSQQHSAVPPPTSTHLGDGSRRSGTPLSQRSVRPMTTTTVPLSMLPNARRKRDDEDEIHRR